MTPGTEPKIMHSIYFILKDRSDESCKSYMATCTKYLSGHPGTLGFSIGTLAYDLRRPVSELNFDVGMNIIFENRQAYDDYQNSPEHQEFIDQTEGLSTKDTVFDTYLI